MLYKYIHLLHKYPARFIKIKMFCHKHLHQSINIIRLVRQIVRGRWGRINFLFALIRHYYFRRKIALIFIEFTVRCEALYLLVYYYRRVRMHKHLHTYKRALKCSTCVSCVIYRMFVMITPVRVSAN